MSHLLEEVIGKWEKKKRKLTFKKISLTTLGKDDIDFSDDEEKEKEAILYLMAFDNDINELYDSSFSCFSYDDEIYVLYNELYDSLVKVKKDLKNKLVENTMLHERIK